MSSLPLVPIARPANAVLAANNANREAAASPLVRITTNPEDMSEDRLENLERQLEPRYMCRITHTAMVDPVYDRRYMGQGEVNGRTRKMPTHVFEHAAIEGWLSDHRELDGIPTTMRNMASYKTLRNEIAANPVAHFIAMRDARAEGRPTHVVELPHHPWRWALTDAAAVASGIAQKATRPVVTRSNRMMRQMGDAIDCQATRTIGYALRDGKDRAVRVGKVVLIVGALGSPTIAGGVAGHFLARKAKDKSDTIGPWVLIGFAANAVLLIALITGVVCCRTNPRRR